MSTQPNGWTEAKLGDLLHAIEAGLNVKCDERPPETGERGLVKISAVTWGRFDELQSKTLPTDAVPGQKNRIQEGDLLISRANTIELVGASVIVGPISRELYLSDKVLRLCVHEPSKRWINYALKTPATKKAIEEASSGNQLSMRNISQEKLKSLSFPLAPEAEQTRIADKLDTVLSRVDAVNARLARVTPLLKRFRQSVLAAATSGRLTEDWRNFQDLNLSAWSVHSIGDRCRLKGGKSWQADLELPSGDFPYIKVGDMNLPENNYAIKTSSRFLAKEFVNESDQVPVGSFIFPKRGGAIATNKKRLVIEAPVVIDLNTMAIVCPKDISVKYLFYWFQTIDLSKLNNGSTIPQVNNSDISPLKFPEPPFEEQIEIVRRVETLFAFADRLEARLKAAQTAAQRLTPAVLAKAFRGELVPQDPADEPAAELLKRLAAQREAEPKARRGRRAGAEA